MNTYKNFIGFKSIFFFCSLPIRLDSYRGCTFNCLYCFSKKLNNRKPGFHSTVIPANPASLTALMLSVLDKGTTSGVIKSCLAHRVPIHFGSVSDPFQPLEEKHAVSYDFLKILHHYDYPVIISTKSDLLLKPKYLSLLRDMKVVIQISFSTLNNELAQKIEPHAPSPTKRLIALKELSKLGIFTVARIQPFLFPLERIEQFGLKALADAGIKHLVLEHLRIPSNSALKTRKKLWDKTGFNFIDYYNNCGLRHSRVNYELRSDFKLKNIIQAREIVHSFNISFGSGDNEFHHFSDSKCCCGVPDNGSFRNYYKGSLGAIAFDSIRNGYVNLDSIWDEWQPTGSIVEYINSDCRLKSINTVQSLIKHKLDNSGSSNSLSSFYGIEKNKNNGYLVRNEVFNLVK